MPDPVAPAAAAPEAVKPPAEKPAEGTALSNTPAPEAKAPEAKPAEGTPPKADEKKPDAAKDVKPIDLKLPEGFSADPALLDEFKKLAQETGLNSESAQKLVEFQAKMNEAAKALAKKEAEEFSAKEAAWKAETAKIPAADLGLAKRAMLHLTKGLSPEMRDETRAVLEQTWMGNHPGVLRLLAAAGKFIAEDVVVEEGAAGKAPFTAADFYPTMKKK
jgi:hypothetical protein